MNKIKIRLIVGLGNPGKEYKDTRHNIGFFFAEEAAKILEAGDFIFKKNLYSEVVEALCKPKNSNGDNIETSALESKIVIAKPQTFMNESGKAATALSKFYKIKSENILVIHDDIDIPWEKFRFSFGHSSAGHKGVESIIKSLKTKNFWRLKIGIQPQPIKNNPPLARIKADKIILKKFLSSELNNLRQTAEKAFFELKTHTY